MALVAFIIATLVAVNFAQQIPEDWKKRISESNMLFSSSELDQEELMSTVGNGFLSTRIGNINF
jgi:hypothetical protein